MSAPRRWARRAALSILAGSGLTAAGLGGAGPALGAETTTATTGTTETPTPPVTETTPQPSAPETAGSQPSGSEPATTTSTAAAPSSTTSAPPATTPAPAAPTSTVESPTAAPTVVVQRKQRVTRARKPSKSASSTGSGAAQTPAGLAGAQPAGPATVPAGTPNGVAPAPQAVGGEAGALASLLSSSAASAQALDFYRIPLFLLPVYQAAAIQYDVPWQILAGINEVETDYGSDLSVSTAGALGWMQFMPQTWLQYGVDATNAGYADPYNPVDAIFAAARYLHAAGASHNLRRAILAYNHSQAYVEAVMLRARLVASYPRSVIGTLTGLVDGQAPTPNARVAPGALYLPASAGAGAGGEGAPSAAAGTAASPAASSTTAGAVPASPLVAGAADGAVAAADPAARARAKAARHASAVPGSTPPPPPQVVAARAEAAADAAAKPRQLMDLLGTPGAAVVAVQNGRVVHLGRSRALGRYLVLRDVYGDIFTYAGLGDIAPRYRRPKPPADLAQHTPGSATAPVSDAAGHGASASAGEASGDPAPTLPASAGHQTPLTLRVKARAKAAHAQPPLEPEAESTAAGDGKVRLYARPHNPLARATAARAAKALAAGNGPWLPLRSGSLVSQGTVLGHLPAAPGAGTLRFAVRPAGDDGTIDPQALLTNWRLLGAALRPHGSKGHVELLGATAAEVFAMSKSELQRSVLSDPGVQLDACGRRDVAEGAIDRRALGVLEFLSRSGLQPTVGALQCARGKTTPTGPVFEHFAGGALDITAVNGIPIAGHQGPGTVTDATIRALLTLPRQFVPHRILSLMEYPHAPNTLASTADWNRIRIGFAPVAAASAHAARVPRGESPFASAGSLSQDQWNQLIDRIAALPQPKVAAKPSAAAIRDPQAAAANRALGAPGPAAGA